MKNPPKIRILIADDHYVVRIGLAALIGVEPDMEVIATAVDGAQALELFRRFQPDLALLDMRMPVKDGIQTAMEIRAQFPEARVIMLTAFDGDEDIHKALQAGAQGYVFKNSSVEKPRLVVANKMDEAVAEKNLKQFKTKIKKVTVLPISAAFDQGMAKFKQTIREEVEKHSAEETSPKK